MVGTLVLAAAVAQAEPVEIRVFERGTGDPIPDAEIREGTRVLGVSDRRGRAVVDLDAGSWVVAVETPTHQPAAVAFEVPVGSVVVALVPVPPPLQVVVESFKSTPHVSRHSVDAEMAWETPGTFDDSVRLVQSLPGVTVQRELSPTAGDLSVRGSGAGDNRYYLDGVLVPYLYHFNQYASVFPSAQLERLQLFPSTFGAAYGDAVGAVVEAETTRDRPQAVHGDVSLNTVMGGASVRAPVGEQGWWFSVSGRRSYQDLAGEQTDQFSVWPVFHDYALRAERRRERGGVGVFLWGAGDHYERAVGELDLLDPVEADRSPNLDYRRGFGVAGVRGDWRGGQGSGRVVGAVVDDRITAEIAGEGEVLRTSYLTSRLDAERDLAEGLGVEAGWDLRAERTGLELDDVGDTALLVTEEAPELVAGVDLVDDRIRVRAAGYAGARIRAGGLRVMPGARAGFDSQTGPTVDPRLAVRLRAAQQTELKIAGGLYHQAPSTASLLIAGSLPTTSSWQVAVGAEQTVATRLELGLEGYRKWLVDPVASIGGALPAPVPSGDVMGVELVTRYRIREVLFLWGWLSVSQARLSTVEGVVSADGDQPVTAGAVLSWDPSDALNLGVRLRYGSGLPYTPRLGSVYDAGQDAWRPVLGTHNGARMPWYGKLDLHSGYTFTFQRWTLTLTAELWAVPRAAAALYPVWSFDGSEQSYVVGPTVLPLLGGRARF